MAFRLFCRTPSRTPSSEKAHAVLKDAQPAMARAERLMLPITTGAVATYAFRPHVAEANETVLVVHGWGSRSEHMLPLVEALRSSGHTVVALDLPGHGASTGRMLHMGLAVEAVDAAWRQFGPFSTMIGHSFGGAVAVNAAYGSVCGVRKHPPARLVTISAPNSLPDFFSWFADWIGLSAASKEVLFGEIQRVTGRPLQEFVTARQIAALNIPTLVVHAHDDKEVVVDNAYSLVGAGAHVEVFWADGYGHRRILSARDVSQVVAEFVERANADTQPSPGNVPYSATPTGLTHS
ncbi:MAG: alpha/beta fold hydrolase [Alphaproteobacteria bacterium]|nr:alpha/beta fold hydrolase [Alphaproteobacteria bacterium]